MEYDIVIVYNFFSKSPFSSLWDKLFRDDNIDDYNDDYKSSVLELKNILAKENIEQLIKSLRLTQYYEDMGEKEIKKKIIKEVEKLKYPSLKKEFDIHSNFDFCSELKQFYVLITRPRTFLLFYEENINSNFSFYKRMINNNIIKKVEKTDKVNYIDEIMRYYEENQMICKNKEEMKKFAEKKMMEEKYEDAAYFFGKAGEKSYQKKAIIYFFFEKIKEDKRNHKLSFNEFKELNKEIISKIKELKSEPRVFQDNENIEAFCYLNLNEYDKALKLFKEKKMYNEVGEIYFEKKYEFEEAFKYFQKAGNISYAIKSIIKSDKKGHLLKLFDYINIETIYSNLGLSEYYNIYEKYINDLFISLTSKKKYTRNIFIKPEDEEKEKENENEEEKNNEEEKENELKNEIPKEEDNIEGKNINGIDEKNINNSSQKEKNDNSNGKKKKKSGKRRRKGYNKRKKDYIEKDKIIEEEDENKNEEEGNNESEDNNKNNEEDKNQENNEENINGENDENNKNDKNEKEKDAIKEEESLKNINNEMELNKTEILNNIIYEVINIIKSRVNEYVFNSIFSSLPIEEKGKFFTDYIFEKVLKEYQKLMLKQYLGEEDLSLNEINNIKEEKQEEENLEIEEVNKNIEELKEKKIELNIKNDISIANWFDYISMDNQKLIEIKNINILKNNPKNRTWKQLIIDIIENYYRNIDYLEKKRKAEHEYNFSYSFYNESFNIYHNEIHISKYLVNLFKEEFKLSNKVNEFIECYYFNTKEYLIKEIIKCMPEIYYYKCNEFKKSSNYVKDLLVKMKETNDKIYENVIQFTKRFIYKVDISEKEINKLLCPLFYLNNFYDISQIFSGNDIFNQKMTEILYLTLNNINKNYEKENIRNLMDINSIMYYLNYKLRYCLTIFIKTGEILFDTEEPFTTYNFKRLKELAKNIKNKQYLKYNKLYNEDIDKLIKNIKEKNIIFNNDNISEIIDLFDITSYISLYLFQLYVDNSQPDNNYNIFIEKNTSEYYNTIYTLYKLSLIFNEINNNSLNYKKLLIFSLFNIFGINPIPNIYFFSVYKSVNCCLLNRNSILLSQSFEETYLDFFSEKNDFIYSKNNKKIVSIFDTNGNNIILSNDILYKIFRLLLSKYANIVFEKNIINLVYPQDPFLLKEEKNENEAFYYEILYYFNLLEYKIIKDDSYSSVNEQQENNNNKLFISSHIFWKNTIKNCKEFFRSYKTFYPYKFGNKGNSFSLNNYILEFFFNKVNSPKTLLSFINEYNNRISSDEFPENDFCYDEMYILFYFIQIYFPEIDLNQYKNNLIFEEIEINKINIDFEEILEIFGCIQQQKPSLVISVLFLRILLPYILKIISLIRDIDTNIYFFKNEQIFNHKVKFLKIDLEIEKTDEKAFIIIDEYLKCLKEVLWNFSLNGKYYSTYFKDIKYFKKTSFLEYRNGIMYNFGINKINKNNIKFREGLETLNFSFEIKYKSIQIDYNWYFHFYEILFNCFYLTFIDCSFQLKQKDKLFQIINSFLNFYEKNDYYLNFIDLDGASMNRARLINENYYKNKFDYEKFNEKYKVREKLWNKYIYNYMTKKGTEKIKLLKRNSDHFLFKEKNEKQTNPDIIFDNKDESNSLFLNNYDDINYDLKRFLFDGYDEKKTCSIEDYYRDILKMINQINN